jgi:hypothetical protein
MFLLLSYIGNTFGSYSQNNSTRRPGINVTMPEQRHEKTIKNTITEQIPRLSLRGIW